MLHLLVRLEFGTVFRSELLVGLNELVADFHQHGFLLAKELELGRFEGIRVGGERVGGSGGEELLFFGELHARRRDLELVQLVRVHRE